MIYIIQSTLLWFSKKCNKSMRPRSYQRNLQCRRDHTPRVLLLEVVLLRRTLTGRSWSTMTSGLTASYSAATRAFSSGWSWPRRAPTVRIWSTMTSGRTAVSPRVRDQRGPRVRGQRGQRDHVPRTSTAEMTGPAGPRPPHVNGRYDLRPDGRLSTRARPAGPSPRASAANGTNPPRVHGLQDHLTDILAGSRPTGPSLRASAASGANGANGNTPPARPWPAGPHPRASTVGEAISPRVRGQRDHVPRTSTAGGTTSCVSAAGGAIFLCVRGQRCHLLCASTSGATTSPRIHGQRGYLPARPRPTGPHPPRVSDQRLLQKMYRPRHGEERTLLRMMLLSICEQPVDEAGSSELASLLVVSRAKIIARADRTLRPRMHPRQIKMQRRSV